MENFVTPLLNLGFALALSLLVGLEREYHAKSAGVRTYTLVGLGSALFTVVSKYGFLETPTGAAVTDGSRIAAQVVTGIGFLGAGVIFVRRDSVKGLTTAAGIWFVAAIGMAAATGLYLVASAATLMYLGIMFGLKPVAYNMPRAGSALGVFAIRYTDGQGLLRTILETVSHHGLKVTDLQVVRQVEGEDGTTLQEVSLDLQGSGAAMAALSHDLWELEGVHNVSRTQHHD
ncbi:MAG: MgtC/SapB family protein [Propionibacteriaceae bacterium]|nr:MgtC/SapB family protein [Micropruina sp.]HBX81055.1 MgtC family protein [Propionibacteriaceae bacterium]HBY24692.1 MgtC family protein [Propionibacteriaceae bacterium]